MTTHHKPPASHVRMLAIRRRRPILPAEPPISAMQPSYPAPRLWGWLVLVAAVILLGIGILVLTSPGRPDSLPEYPQATTIVHTITNNSADPFFAQTVTFQTSDSPETILAFYQWVRPIQPGYSCRVVEQTAAMIDINCLAFKPEATMFHRYYRISVTTIAPQIRSVEVEESGSVTRAFNP